MTRHSVDRAPTMVDLHPRPGSADRAALRGCIDACLAAEQACTACADACLAEQDTADLVTCIRRCQDLADVAEATARVLSRQTAGDAFTIRTLLLACSAAAAACALECLEHASHHEHARVCAEVCRDCERACLVLTEGELT